MLTWQSVTGNSSLLNKVQGQNGEQPEPRVPCSLGGRHDVNDEQGGAVEDDGVQPVHFRYN